MISDIPFTAVNRTSSACANAAERDKPLRPLNLSVFTMIIQSTNSFNLLIPSSACCFLLRPSKLNGNVTTPTTSIFSLLSGNSMLFAISATTGEAPVPVPPPIPAVMKSILVFSPNICLIFSLFSSAA